MENLLKDILTNASTLLILLIAYKSGLLKAIMNGRFWNGNKTTDAKIDELKDNHFHTLQEGQNEIKNDIRDIKNSLGNIERYGVKIRK